MKNCNREYIIIRQCVNGYQIREDKFVAGFMTIESVNQKCNLSIHMQCLKTDTKYKANLFIAEIEGILKIDFYDFEVNKHGKMDTSFNFMERNICNEDIYSKQIVGISIETQDNELVAMGSLSIKSHEEIFNLYKFK